MTFEDTLTIYKYKKKYIQTTSRDVVKTISVSSYYLDNINNYNIALTSVDTKAHPNHLLPEVGPQIRPSAVQLYAHWATRTWPTLPNIIIILNVGGMIERNSRAVIIREKGRRGCGTTASTVCSVLCNWARFPRDHMKDGAPEPSFGAGTIDIEDRRRRGADGASLARWIRLRRGILRIDKETGQKERRLI